MLSPAVEFTVPIGKFDRQMKMDEREYQKLLTQNRSRYCAPFDPSLLAASQAVQNSGVSFNLEEQKAL